MIATHGLPLGIDFSGGTIVIVKFQQPTTEDAVRSALDGVPGEKVVQQYGDPAQQRDAHPPAAGGGAEQGFSLEQGARQVIDALDEANLPASSR